MLEKITDHARFVAIKAEEFYEQALQKTGPAKEKALEMTNKTVEKICRKQIEIKKYTHEISKAAGYKLVELKKSINFSHIMDQLMDNICRNYRQAIASLVNIKHQLQKISGKKFNF